MSVSEDTRKFTYQLAPTGPMGSQGVMIAKLG
jgi:hypothetical protein